MYIAMIGTMMYAKCVHHVQKAVSITSYIMLPHNFELHPLGCSTDSDSRFTVTDTLDSTTEYEVPEADKNT